MDNEVREDENRTEGGSAATPGPEAEAGGSAGSDVVASSNTGSRRYRKRRRAEQERETRQRIVDAAVKLHSSIGPAQTTISRIAEEAGVQRATVYRHFPDEATLFASCSARYLESNPLPDLEEWTAITDPAERLRVGLGRVYEFYRRTEPMLDKTSRDAPLVEAMSGPMEVFLDFLEAASETITAGRPERGAARRRVRAAVGHAISFATWQSLVRQQGLEDSEAAALMVALVESAAAARPATADRSA